MMRHLFKLAWNRKRASSLILVEILISFLVLCALFTMAMHGVSNYKKPLGFDYQDLWAINISGAPRLNAPPEQREASRVSLKEMISVIEEMPEVRHVAISYNCPFSNTTVMSSTWIDGRREYVQWGTSTVSAIDVFRLQIEEGRWLEVGDEFREEIPTVVTRNLAEAYFPGENAIGKIIPRFNEDGGTADAEEGDPDRRIVGICADYRSRGELSESIYTMFDPLNIDDAEEYFPGNLVVRAQPGTDASFEEKLVSRLQIIEPSWAFSVSYLPEMRTKQTKQVIMPFVVICIVAGFLVVMVGLGLVGVLWQSLLRRTSELGLRRAMGASADGVRVQILLELLFLASLAMAVGSLIFLQVPLLGLIAFVAWQTWLLALTMALVSIVVLVSICGLVPSWMATKITPAEALQYE
jgi:putative ABC transport system permease protein